MEPFEKVALQIATDDLRYAAGSTLSAREPVHPKLWPSFQWGVTLAFEGQKHLARAHGIQLELGWNPAVAEAARHSSKLFDDSWLLVEGVIQRFEDLLDANRLCFFPEVRDRDLDRHRTDLSVMTDGSEVVLTNVSGLFMMGVPVEVASNYSAVGPLGHELALGLGHAAASLTGQSEGELNRHGNRDLPPALWSDADSRFALASVYGGALPRALAVALITLHSAVQCAREWTLTDCCDSCGRASRKHRYVVLYQALRSLEALRQSSLAIGALAQARLAEALEPAGGAPAILSPPFRRLRNGWLHLGMGDIANRLPAEPTADDIVHAYTGLDVAELDGIVAGGLNHFAAVSNSWMLEAGPDGSTLFDHLRTPR